METNTKKKKLTTTGLAIALAALLLIGGGTFAYLQSQTKDTVNTFSANKVLVGLEESTGESYNIIPGTTQAKDPTVTVDNSVDAYVYVKVTDNTKKLVTYEIADGWMELKGVENVYYREVKKSDSEQKFEVLKDNTVTYSAALENSNMLNEDGSLKDGITLSFNASATQKAPFDDPVKAYFQADEVVSTAEDLGKAITKAKAGDTIAVNGKVSLTSPLTINTAITLVGDEDTLISGQPITTKADVNFVNVAFEKPTNNNKNATIVYGQAGTEELVFENCTFSDPQWEVMQITSNDFKTLTVNNCTFTADNVDGATSGYGNTADQAIRYIHIQPNPKQAPTVDVTITNNTFKDCNKVKNSIVGIYYVSSDSTITVGGNNFEGWADDDVNADGVTGKLSVGWPEVAALKTISNWEGNNRTFKIDSTLNQ